MPTNPYDYKLCHLESKITVAGLVNWFSRACLKSYPDSMHLRIDKGSRRVLRSTHRLLIIILSIYLYIRINYYKHICWYVISDDIKQI